MVVSAAEVVSFWREAGPDRWFNKDAAFDRTIHERFFDTYEAAATGKLSDWEHSAQGALALLILLDQFPRNMFRGDARTYAADPLARAVAERALDHGFDRQVLSGPELPRPDRRVALRGELRRQPGKCAAEHMSRVDHHPAPLVWSRRNDGPELNVARQPVADTREPQAVLAVSPEWLAR